MTEQGTTHHRELQLPLKVGIDIGSKTIKIAVLDNEAQTVHFFYDRHLSNVKQTLRYALKRIRPYCEGKSLTIGVTGSAGIPFAELMGLPFVQEVMATRIALQRYFPHTDVAIELGGEDSKIVFLSQGEELRMNNTCAGGTGGFIDTIAGMFDLNAEEFNNLALGSTNIYPIASRCAVFAQSDVRPLLNEGVSRYDIAASVFAAVATQCISGLACGRKITGKIALLGGPFHFLSALRNAFSKALDSDSAEVFVPTEAHLFVAKGAALFAEDMATPLTLEELDDRLSVIDWNLDTEDKRLPPLFTSEQEYRVFKQRHDLAKPEYGTLNGYQGRAFLGIDSGSTTIKCVLISEEGRFLFTYYERVAGDLIDAAELMLRKLYSRLPRLPDGKPAVNIVHTCVTGYGEDFLCKAFEADSGEVETLAHLRAAEESVPDVDMILDIGGQDIKYLTVRNGHLNDIVLNEACSSGCGALIGGFAYSMNVRLPEFTEAALFAEKPVDLGTRCTVFMTSRVRHAQKEGASVGEISAGLAYSVVRNALFKVIRLSDKKALGNRIVVQGGTFKSDAVLRAFELLCGCEVYRSGASEYMGAYGAALLAQERASDDPHAHTTLLDEKALDRLQVKRTTTHCQLCSNQCLLTMIDFSEEAVAIAEKKESRRLNSFDAVFFDQDTTELSATPLREKKREPRRLIVGNRCTRPLGIRKNGDSHLFDLFDYSYQRIFNYRSLSREDAWRGCIGIPRVLNFYDDYPLWHTFLTCLGYRVELSDPSDRSVYLRGAETIVSESACYPSKITNGHLLNLIDKGLNTVFYPSITKGFSGNLQCSVMAQNPLVLGLNIEDVYQGRVQLIAPHIDYQNRAGMSKELYEALEKDDSTITEQEIEAALSAGFEALEAYKADIRNAGNEALKGIKDSKGQGIILAGRPYHLDPEMHHGLPAQLKSFGLSVLTVESVEHLVQDMPPLYVDDRWEYPARSYRAAQLVLENQQLDLIELYSFGCGLDSVTCDQVRDILEARERLYTSLKIDEMSDLAASRIRMRSMLAALQKDARQHASDDLNRSAPGNNPLEDAGDSQASLKALAAGKGDESVLLVNWLPGCAQDVVSSQTGLGERIALLPQEGADTVLAGLANSNNDVCFSSLYGVGQTMSYCAGNKVSQEPVRVLVPHTCVGCRAGDLPGLIRKALFDAGYPIGFVTSVAACLQNNASDDEGDHETELIKAAYAILLWSLGESLLTRVRPYVQAELSSVDLGYPVNLREAVADEHSFSCSARRMLAAARTLLPGDIERKPRIALVGTAPTLFNTTINDNTVSQIEHEGCEVFRPYFSDFILYALTVGTSRRDMGVLFQEASTQLSQIIEAEAGDHIVRLVQPLLPLETYRKLALCSGLVSEHETSGAGWLYVGHILDALGSGIEHIIYAHSFGCLPAHTTGRGIFRALRSHFRNLNITSIEYDPGASGINQSNRIKLLTSLARIDQQKTQEFESQPQHLGTALWRKNGEDNGNLSRNWLERKTASQSQGNC